MNKLIIAAAMTVAMATGANAQSAPNVNNLWAGGVCYGPAPERTVIPRILGVTGCQGDPDEALRLAAERWDAVELDRRTFQGTVYGSEMERNDAERIFNTITDSDGNVLPLTPEDLWDPANGYVTVGVQDEGRVANEAAERRARAHAQYLLAQRNPTPGSPEAEAQSARFDRLFDECDNPLTDPERRATIIKYSEPGVHGSEYATLSYRQYQEIIDTCEAEDGLFD